MTPIKKLYNTKVSPFGAPFHFGFMKQVQIPTFYLANLKSDLFSWAFLGPQGPRGASDQKVVKYQSVIIWCPLQLCFYEASPNSNFLLSKLEIPLYFPDFPGPLGPQGCISRKSLLYQIETGGGPLQLCFYEEAPILTLKI